MALTVTIVVGQRSTGARPRSEIAELLLQRLPEARFEVVPGVGAARFGVQIEITNDGAAVPWSVSQTVMHCVFRPPQFQRRRRAR